MKTTFAAFFALVIASSHFVVVGSSAAPRYRVVDLGTLGGPESWGRAINNHGDVTGGSTLPGQPDVVHAFLFTRGRMLDIGTLGGSFSFGEDINDRRQIVGLSTFPGASLWDARAFLYENGSMRDIGTLGGNYGAAHGINNSGHVTGLTQTASGDYFAFLYQDGAMINIGSLGSSSIYSYGYSINNRDEIVGRSVGDDGAVHAVMYSNGTMSDLGCVGDAYDINDGGTIVGTCSTGAFLYKRAATDLSAQGVVAAYGVNNRGQIVGAGWSDGQSYGLLYDKGAVTNLNEALDEASVGWLITQAKGINDRGQIVAIGVRSGAERAVRLDPAPPANGPTHP